MAGVRHVLFVILAIAGLFSALSAASAATACPAEPVVASMQHHGGCGDGVPVRKSTDFCAACLAVLPSPRITQPQSELPLTPFASLLEPLSGVDPALDPPPPRAG